MSEQTPKIVVISGATSGIGQSCANLFAKHGATVINISRKENPEMTFAADYRGSVADEPRIVAIFDDIRQKYGRVDILINNAGYGLSGATELITTDEARAIFETNVMGKFIVAKYALPLMGRGGKLFYISSSMAVHPVPFRALYGATKAAVRNMALAQRMELREYGIDVCCVMPGDIKTNFTENRVKDFTTNDRYGDRMKNAAERLDQKEGKRMSPDVVARVIYKQSRRKSTRAQVIVGFRHRLLYRLTHGHSKLYLKMCEKACAPAAKS